ncbi:MAG: hypothetical protein GXO49_04910 [Chlorobi bacterium]|nr:hypothetical protein [Chlorobiota bacterium]
MNEIISFKEEIFFRLKSPWKQSAFNGVFAIVVILAGFGVFFPFMIKNNFNIPDISISLGTYFIASIVSSSLDLGLSIKTINKASYIIYTILALVITLILFSLAITIRPNFWKLSIAVFGFVLSFMIWIIANSDKEIFDDLKYTKKLERSIKTTSEIDDMLNELKNENE